MRAFRDGRGDLDYQRWWLGVGVLTHCRGGRELAHSWSAGTPSRYDGAKLDQFFDRWVEWGGAPLCASFDAIGGCQGCAIRSEMIAAGRSPRGLGEPSIEDVRKEKAKRRLLDASPRSRRALLQSAWSSRIVRSYTK